MDGLDVDRHIRARSQVPMLFITARAEVDDEMAGMASGAAAYLTKPFRPRQITELVNQLCPAGPLAALRTRLRKEDVLNQSLPGAMVQIL